MTALATRELRHRHQDDANAAKCHSPTVSPGPPKKLPVRLLRGLMSSSSLSILAILTLLSLITSARFLPDIRCLTWLEEVSSEQVSPSQLSGELRRPRKIVWLLSFPNSGTTYTIANAERMSNMSTATNYAAEVKSDVVHPLNPQESIAPFVFSPHLELPDYTLTKTHCTGYSDRLHHLNQVFNVHTFGQGCRSAAVSRECSNDVIEYRPKLVAKAIHLVRDPFDNIVARMHLGKRERQLQNLFPVNLLATFTETPEGVLAWCTHVDGLFHDENLIVEKPVSYFPPSRIEAEVLAAMTEVPCHSEWFRYVQWHNLAIEMLENEILLETKVHTVYYENYTTAFNETVHGIADYLGQPVVQPPKTFVQGKTYGHLFSNADKVKVARLIRSLATPSCWALLRPYFEGWFDETPDRNYASTSTAVRAAWLVAFRPSGSKFLLRTLKNMTGMAVAYHHYKESRSNLTVLPGIANSPLIEAGLQVPRLVPVLTVCSKQCFDCSLAQDLQSFGKSCRRVTAELENGEKKAESSDTSVDDSNASDGYDQALVGAAIVVFRNPFDVIRSRVNRALILEADAEGQNLTEVNALLNTRQAVDQHCAVVDKHLESTDEPPKPEDVRPTFLGVQRSVHDFAKFLQCPRGWFASQERYSRLTNFANDERFRYVPDRSLIDQFRHIPCYSDFLRYIQWYNHALHVVSSYRLFRERTLYLEELTIGSAKRSLKNTARFLQLPTLKYSGQFIQKRAEPLMLWTDSEAREIAKLFETFSSPELWELIRPYFENEQGSFQTLATFAG